MFVLVNKLNFGKFFKFFLVFQVDLIVIKIFKKEGKLNLYLEKELFWMYYMLINWYL